MSTKKSAALVPEEALKETSRYLRGTIRESLDDIVTGTISDDDAKLLKFHGIYVQDDRDIRQERLHRKLEPAYSFLIRVRLPGGVLTSDQWLKLDRLAIQYGFPSLRITTRQTFQYHGVLKRNLRKTIQGIHEALLDAIAACGDVNRNVFAHNNPHRSPHHAELHALAKRISDAFLPKTRAFHEIWLDGKEVTPTQEDHEPLYGKTYLPRKFKIGIALPPSNDVDVFAQDLGFIAIVKKGKIQGYNVAVGGGMGTTHSDTKTYPRLASVIGFVKPDQVLEVTEKVLEIQRDFGDRTNRKHSRFKYTIDDRGLPWFQEELEKRLGWSLKKPEDYAFSDNGDLFGWYEDDEGFWHLTLSIPSGRLRDTPEISWLTAFREIAKIHKGDFRLTCNQNVTIAKIDLKDRESVEAILRAHHIPYEKPTSALRQRSVSCVAFPTCGLAMAESERWLPQLATRLESVLDEYGLRYAPINLRVTGCPNGCGRPFLGEIGLVGKSPGRYNLYLGAAHDGSRLNRLYRESLNEQEIVEALIPILKDYSVHREPNETFGDFVIRKTYVSAVLEGKDFHAAKVAS
jgi:sulfite reductase (NADPH) hemoprotein beta-component